MPKCTINGKEIEVKEGTSVIEAFSQIDEKIAHYCWHPGLSVAGVCRMCMVEIEGVPKLQIACNTKINDGMVITNQSEKVKEAVKWTLDFHLINHPLDCPICDQAGECGLQNQYMSFGKYDPEMSETKVKKRKVVDLGSKVVLDSERCILCSRCVRFTDEVSQTHELGIFNRGDRSEIGTFKDKPLENNYSVNTVDICPVGALTSKQFRFQQRVWFLKEQSSVCPGCSTGCNINVFYNQLKAFRAKPIFNKDVNGYWMCDEGRDISHVNRENRLLRAKKIEAGQSSQVNAGEAIKEIKRALDSQIEKEGAESVALVLTAQYTVEEIEAIVRYFKNELKSNQVYYWINNKDGFDDFDGLLLRGDRNPNTFGLLETLEKEGLSHTWDELQNNLQTGQIKSLVVAGPELQRHYPDIQDKVDMFCQAENIYWFTSSPVQALDSAKGVAIQIPMRSFFEKEGTFVNREGRRQVLQGGPLLVGGAFTIVDVVQMFSGKEVLPASTKVPGGVDRLANEYEKERGQL